MQPPYAYSIRLHAATEVDSSSVCIHLVSVLLRLIYMRPHIYEASYIRVCSASYIYEAEHARVDEASLYVYALGLIYRSAL